LNKPIEMKLIVFVALFVIGSVFTSILNCNDTKRVEEFVSAHLKYYGACDTRIPGNVGCWAHEDGFPKEILETTNSTYNVIIFNEPDLPHIILRVYDDQGELSYLVFGYGTIPYVGIEPVTVIYDRSGKFKGPIWEGEVRDIYERSGHACGSPVK
jgi:hypothetical protein